MLFDEENSQNMRIYNKRYIFEKYLPYVYKFYFDDMQTYGEQRTDTCNLALAYFIQICARVKIDEKEIAMLVAACILIASKLDEIDNNLLCYETIYCQFLLVKNKHKDLSKQRLSIYRLDMNGQRTATIHQDGGESAQVAELEP